MPIIIMDAKSSKFGECLYRAISKAGINQSRLASLVGVTHVTISEYISGKRFPQYNRLIKIAAVLKTSVAELTGEAPPTERPSHQYGIKIRQIRKAKDLSQGALARETGIPQNSICDYESGRSDIPAARLVLISRALRVPIHEITGYKTEADVEELQRKIRELDIDQVLIVLRDKGYGEKAVEFVRLLHQKKLESWQIEAIKAILEKAEIEENKKGEE